MRKQSKIQAKDEEKKKHVVTTKEIERDGLWMMRCNGKSPKAYMPNDTTQYTKTNRKNNV